MEFITVSYDKAVDRATFDCGTHPPLNLYIAQQAGQDEKRNLSRTFMYLEDGVLLGYYTLANSSIALSELNEEQQRKLPHYPMPAVLLSRLAVDKSTQGKGLGKRLVSDCFRRIHALSKHSGVAFSIVDAKDQPAADYYQHHLGFTPSHKNPLRLVLPMGTVFKAMQLA